MGGVDGDLIEDVLGEGFNWIELGDVWDPFGWRWCWNVNEKGVGTTLEGDVIGEMAENVGGDGFDWVVDVELQNFGPRGHHERNAGVRINSDDHAEENGVLREDELCGVRDGLGLEDWLEWVGWGVREVDDDWMGVKLKNDVVVGARVKNVVEIAMEVFEWEWHPVDWDEVNFPFGLDGWVIDGGKGGCEDKSISLRMDGLDDVLREDEMCGGLDGFESCVWFEIWVGGVRAARLIKGDVVGVEKDPRVGRVLPSQREHLIKGDVVGVEKDGDMLVDVESKNVVERVQDGLGRRWVDLVCLPSGDEICGDSVERWEVNRDGHLGNLSWSRDRKSSSRTESGNPIRSKTV
jgi:hypothetical protein